MRSRNLKPGFFKNEILGSADPLYGLLFQGLWLMADREGRLEDRPRRISAELFPYRRRVTECKVDEMLEWLHRQRFIERYQTEQGRFIQVVEFGAHQNPHKNEAPSKIPALSSILHQSHSENGPANALESTPEHSGADVVPRPKANRASSLIPSSLIPDSPLTALPESGRGNGGGKVKTGGPGEAWRDVTECDPEAYEHWLQWRVEEHDAVPPRVRIQDAKFLAGKGTAEQQRAFIDELIRLRFRRLHDPIGGFGNGNGHGRAAPEADPPITWHPDQESKNANG